MVPKETKAVCPACRKSFRTTPKISLLGFQKIQCPKCGKVSVHPLFQRRYYWIGLIVLALVALFSAAGYSSSPWGDKLLTLAVLSMIYVMERVSYLLFPLAAWAVLRLLGMHYPWALEMSRTILWYTGLAALIGIMIAILGGVASLVWRGIILEPLLVALGLGVFFLAILGRDKMLRGHLQKT